MTDLEMTKLCAEAIGYDEYSEHVDADGHWYIYLERDAGIGTRTYWPLADDAQSMKLVRMFMLSIDLEGSLPVWRVCADYGRSVPICAFNKNINRAICECIAEMWTEK